MGRDSQGLAKCLTALKFSCNVVYVECSTDTMMQFIRPERICLNLFNISLLW
jgi:hypothetical protein